MWDWEKVLHINSTQILNSLLNNFHVLKIFIPLCTRCARQTLRGSELLTWQQLYFMIPNFTKGWEPHNERRGKKTSSYMSLLYPPWYIIIREKGGSNLVRGECKKETSRESVWVEEIETTQVYFFVLFFFCFQWTSETPESKIHCFPVNWADRGWRRLGGIYLIWLRCLLTKHFSKLSGKFLWDTVRMSITQHLLQFSSVFFFFKSVHGCQEEYGRQAIS